MSNLEQEREGRVLRSARAVKAFFEHKLRTSFEFLAAPPGAGELSEGDVRFGLALSQYGLWGVRAAKTLDAGAQSEIYETFHAILASGRETSAERGGELERLEAKMTQALEEAPANVIPLRRPRWAGRDPADHRRWVLRLDCLIEAPYFSEIHRMAFELHSHSKRYAFVDYRDIQAARRLSVEDLLGLGAITIYIHDLQELGFQEQLVLNELVAVASEQRPLIMAGTTLPFAELRVLDTIHKELVLTLGRAYIKLSKPFSEYKKEGLIRFFLDSLAEDLN